MKLMVKSVMPLSMGLWWYATAYAIFLMLLPFLAKGLKALGREYHLALAATVLVIWGLTSFVPLTLGSTPMWHHLSQVHSPSSTCSSSSPPTSGI